MDLPQNLSDTERANKIIERIKAVEKTLESANMNFSSFFIAQKQTDPTVFKGIDNTRISKMKKLLTSFIDSGNPSYNLKGALFQFEEKIERIEKAYRPDFIQNKSVPSPSEQEGFIGKSWYLYFFYIKPGSKKIDPSLGRAVLHIDSELPRNKNVLCENVIQDGVSKNYEGSFDYIDGDNEVKMVYFDLKALPTKNKKNYTRLHIKISCLGHEDEISLGAYITYEHNKITTGSVVLSLIKDDEPVQNLSSAILSHNKQPDEFLNATPLAIRQYLSLKSFNYSKIANTVHTLYDLEKMVTDRHFKRNLFFFDEQVPIVYISTPITSLNNDTKQNNNTAINNLVNLLKVKYDNNIAIEYPKWSDNNVGFKQKFKKFKESIKRTRFYVLIITEIDQGSLALTELGLALAYCKNIIIYYKANSISSRLRALGSLGDYIYTIEITDNDIEALFNLKEFKPDTNLDNQIIYNGICTLIDNYTNEA